MLVDNLERRFAKYTLDQVQLSAVTSGAAGDKAGDADRAIRPL
jgi:hypothetical protein